MKRNCHFLLPLFAGLFFAARQTCCYAQIGKTDTVAAVAADTSVMYQSPSGYKDEKAGTARFDTINSVDKVSVRVINDSTIARLKQDKDYWYADVAQKKEKPPKQQNPDSFLDKSWIRTLLWILITAVFAGAVIWFLASSNISLFRKQAESKAADETAEPGEDIFALAYEKELAAAIAAKQYRPAVRLLYLRTLRDLSEGGFIQYSQDKTNSDYLAQLSGTGYYTGFFNLTRTFEYVWYGRQEPGDETFGRIHNHFDQFKSGLRS